MQLLIELREVSSGASGLSLREARAIAGPTASRQPTLTHIEEWEGSRRACRDGRRKLKLPYASMPYFVWMTDGVARMAREGLWAAQAMQLATARKVSELNDCSPSVRLPAWRYGVCTLCSCCGSSRLSSAT
jgi:hypothetical protein